MAQADRKPRLDGFRPVLHVRRPRCPACGSTKLRAYRTSRRPDGVIRYSRCEVCQVKLLILVD